MDKVRPMADRTRAWLAIGALTVGGLSLGGLLAFGVSSHTPDPVRPIVRGESCGGDRVGADARCGPGEDCCTALVVPAGEVRRAYDGAMCSDPAFVAEVSTFALDRFEVTVGRFRRFLEAGGGTRLRPPAVGDGALPTIANSGWQPAYTELLALDRGDLERRLACGPAATWTTEPAATDDRPINCLTWYEAFAFCTWDGGRLPTEAEWNLAAAGGTPERERPWASAPAAIERANAVYGEAAPFPVGSCSPAGDGRWGHADLAGNVWEWMLDANEGTGLLPREGAHHCSTAGLPMPCQDCVSMEGGARVLRGGGFGMPALGMRVAVRRADDPTAREHVFGLRCARPVENGVGAHESAPLDARPPTSVRLRLRGFSAPSLGMEHAAALPFDMLASGRPRLLIVQACAWDPAAGEVARALDARRAGMDQHGVAAVLLLAEGRRRGQSADVIDAATFARDHALTLPVVIDEDGGSQCDVATLFEVAHLEVLQSGASADALDASTPLGRGISEDE